MAIPDWIDSFLSEGDLEEIKQAVLSAEAKTSGEIVPVFVKSSSTTGHVFWVLGLLSLLAVYPFVIEAETVWSAGMVIAAVALAFVLARLNPVKRLLVPISDRIAQCDRRAELEFFENKLSHTDGGTGVLIFVSLLEHRIVILADEGINKKVGSEMWADLVSQLEKDIKKGAIKEGFKNAIHSCGEVLSVHFPRDPNDQNELSDHLVVKD